MRYRSALALAVWLIVASSSLVWAQGTGWRVRQGSTDIFVGTVARPQTDGTDFGTTTFRWDIFAGTLNIDDVLTSTSYFAAPVGTDCTAATIGYSYTGDTDTGWTSVSANTLTACLGGAGELTLTATALSPFASDGNALGTGSLMWSDLFLANGSVINFDNGDVTITHAGNLLTIAGGNLLVADGTVGGVSGLGFGAQNNTGLVRSTYALVVQSRGAEVAKFDDGTAGGSVTFSGTGPHAFGGSVSANVQLGTTGTFAPAGATARAFNVGSTLTVGAGQAASLLSVNSATFTEAGSGNHASLNALEIQAPTVTGGVATVTNTSMLYIPSAMTATVTGANYAIWSDAGTNRLDGDINTDGVLLISTTAPTISSGFGTTPSIAASNGTAAFTINVGTGGSASSGVIGLPTATTGWVVTCTDLTTPGVNVTKQTAVSTTSATVTNYNSTTGLAAAWGASDILYCQATAF